ncbi:SIR2 family protein [Adhaeribacter aquaticus]|uniref:SIR2 family protein n=1 Tax=Adhaeribacter aquaticus TaxID=299567 RepID=UPI0004277368|nr:SIR2 family protein [Adhaeribacter aquaticus]
MRKQFGEDKIIILLGAGASCDAGMLNSIQMIAAIENLLKGEWAKYKDLYNYIQSSYYHLERIKGIDTKSLNFNIENLVGLLNVIINIADKNIDVYPFIGSWEKELLVVAGPKLELAIKFKEEILTKLKNIWLSPDDLKKRSSYYRKMKETGYTMPLRIFSLNYDMCIEENLGIENIERGFGEDKIWDYRRYEPSQEQAISYFLYKLHGSLDWKRNPQTRLTYSDSISSIDPLNMEIIFGIQNKLQSYDPYLFYFYSFREACIRSEIIVISGYGFYDKHINDNLESAFQLDTNKRLLVNVYEGENFDEQAYIEKLSNLLKINSDNITVNNLTAKEFFTNNLNLDYFSSLFPDEDDEAILP